MSRSVPASALAIAAALMAGCMSETGDMDSSEGGQTGRTGSMARFQVVGDHLSPACRLSGAMLD